MRRLIPYCSILVFLLTLACGNLETVEKPKKLIDEKTMEKILYDAVMMDVMQTFSELNPTFEEILGAPYLYKKYKIDSLQLVQSEEYYIKNPRIYYRIYSKVISQLQKSKDSIDTLFNNREKDTQ
jgi:hypothetical protein